MKHKPVKTYYRWRKRRIIYFFAAILLIMLIPALILSVYVFHHVYYRGIKAPEYPLQNVFSSEDFMLADIGHLITTEDGEVLWCSEIRANTPKGVVIYLSDLKEPSVTYFYGHAAWMKEKGYSSFLLEVRAHGESTGGKLGLGYLEVEDVRALVNYIRAFEKYKDVPIIVQGVGLGGTIALNAIGLIPEIDGCIAMSPYASVEDQLELTMKKYHIPGFLRTAERAIFHQTLRFLYGKDAADNCNPRVQILNAKDRPVLVVAALNDPEVPVENSYILQRISADAEMWIRNSGDHYVIKNNDFKNMEKDVEYLVYISGFLDKVIQSASK